MEGEDTLERRCEGHDRSPSSKRPRVNVMAGYEWTGVWIANRVAMMSMKTNAVLTFIDIAPMLKINELEDICFGL
jgi:glutamine cyclotransferase